MNSQAEKLAQICNDALEDADFRSFEPVFEARNVRTWSSREERALLFGLAKATGGSGIIVELGSFCGGSAAFFAKGLCSASPTPSGKVICVDPLLGAPPWLPLPNALFTLTEITGNLAHFEVSDLIDFQIGDSASVGAVWPALPIDILLIDGDHSYEGALRDIESWVPKLKDGGVLVFDDIDGIEEMRLLDVQLRQMQTIAQIGSVGGSSVYRVIRGGWAFLSELKVLLMDAGVHRPWSYEPVHSSLPGGHYKQTRLWTDPNLDIAYDLAFLVTQQNGDHGVMAGSSTSLLGLARSVHEDRRQGDFHVLTDPRKYGRSFRAFFCPYRDVSEAATLLMPGGILIVWDETPLTESDARDVQERMRKAGLDGVGCSAGLESPVFWGVSGIAQLTPLSLVKGHMAVRQSL